MKERILSLSIYNCDSSYRSPKSGTQKGQQGLSYQRQTTTEIYVDVSKKIENAAERTLQPERI
jgi:hypothetical protein